MEAKDTTMPVKNSQRTTRDDIKRLFQSSFKDFPFSLINQQASFEILKFSLTRVTQIEMTKHASPISFVCVILASMSSFNVKLVTVITY